MNQTTTKRVSFLTLLSTGQFAKIEGYKFSVDGIDLAVHKSIGINGEKIAAWHKWSVSEPRSGLAIPYSRRKTRNEAVADATESIRKYGVDNVKKAIAKQLLKKA